MTLRILIISLALAFIYAACRKEEDNIPDQINVPSPTSDPRNGLYTDGNGRTFKIQVHDEDLYYWDFKSDSTLAWPYKGFVRAYYGPTSGGLVKFAGTSDSNVYEINCGPAGPTLAGEYYKLSFNIEGILYELGSISSTNGGIYMYPSSRTQYRKIEDAEHREIKTFEMKGNSVYFNYDETYHLLSIDTMYYSGTFNLHWEVYDNVVYNSPRVCQYTIDRTWPFDSEQHLPNAFSSYLFDEETWFKTSHSQISFSTKDTLIFNRVDSFPNTDQDVVIHDYVGILIK